MGGNGEVSMWDDQKESLTLKFALAICPAMQYQCANKWPHDVVAQLVLDYAEALADEFIRRQTASPMAV